MSAERRIQRAQSGVKQRRKSTSHLEHRSVSAGSLSTQQDLTNLRHLSEPAGHRDSVRVTLSRNSSSSSSQVKLRKSDSNLRRQDASPGLGHSKSVDGGSYGASPPTPVSHAYHPGNKDVMEYYYSTEREMSIEEEQQARIMHLYRVVVVWKKRWKQVRDQNLLMADRLEHVEHEYRAVCESYKEIYERKIGRMREDLKKASRAKDEVLKEKRSLETSFKHMLEHHKMEKADFEGRIRDLQDEAMVLQNSLVEQTSRLVVLKEQLEDYEKRDANNNELSSHNKSLQEENKNLSNHLRSMEIQLREASLRDESYKLLLDTSLDKLRLLEDAVPKKDRIRKCPPNGGRYVLKVNHTEPVQMYLENLDNLNQQRLETQSLDSLDSLDSIPEHLESFGNIMSSDLINNSDNNNIPPNYKEALKWSDSSMSCLSMSSGARSSYPSNMGSTPSVFTDSPVYSPGSPPDPMRSPPDPTNSPHNPGKPPNKHLPLQKSFTIDTTPTPPRKDSPMSENSYNGLSPETVDIRQAIHSTPDLRQFNQSLSPEYVHITQSASQLPLVSNEEYTLRRNGSMDSDILLSDTLKRKKKKDKSENHRRRGSLDIDILAGPIQKPAKSSRFDILRNRKNGVIADDVDVKGKNRFADIFRKLTSSNSNLHDVEKRNSGSPKKRKARSMKR